MDKISEVNIFCDGGSRGNPGPAAAAFVVKGADGMILAREGKVLGVTTNNVAEYTGVLMAFQWIVENLSNQRVNFYLDSQLVVNQLTGVYKIKDKRLLQLALQIQAFHKEFPGKIFYTHVRRAYNKDADALVNETLDAPQN